MNMFTEKLTNKTYVLVSYIHSTKKVLRLRITLCFQCGTV